MNENILNYLNPKIEKMSHSKYNKICNDCFELNPQYVSVNNAVFICNKCSEVHSTLGDNISLVKSINSDTINENETEIIQRGGNFRFNQLLGLYNISKTTSIEIKYKVKAADYYRNLLITETKNHKTIPELPDEDEGVKLIDNNNNEQHHNKKDKLDSINQNNKITNINTNNIISGVPFPYSTTYDKVETKIDSMPVIDNTIKSTEHTEHTESTQQPTFDESKTDNTESAQSTNITESTDSTGLYNKVGNFFGCIKDQAKSTSDLIYMKVNNLHISDKLKSTKDKLIEVGGNVVDKTKELGVNFVEKTKELGNNIVEKTKEVNKTIVDGSNKVLDSDFVQIPKERLVSFAEKAKIFFGYNNEENEISERLYNYNDEDDDN